MFCPNCGTAVSDEDSFCANCGAALDPTDNIPFPVKSVYQKKKHKAKKFFIIVGIIIFAIFVALFVIGLVTPDDTSYDKNDTSAKNSQQADAQMDAPLADWASQVFEEHRQDMEGPFEHKELWDTVISVKDGWINAKYLVVAYDLEENTLLMETYCYAENNGIVYSLPDYSCSPTVTQMYADELRSVLSSYSVTLEDGYYILENTDFGQYDCYPVIYNLPNYFERICVVYCKDEKDCASIEEVIKNSIPNEIDSAIESGASDEEVERIQNSLITTRGNRVFWCICPDHDAALKIINSEMEVSEIFRDYDSMI